MNLAGPLQTSTFKTYRVAKVAGCAAWLAKEMLDKFAEFKVDEDKAADKDWQDFEKNLELLHKGLNHELAMCSLVEDNNFGIIKRFESHERVPKDYRKRADVVTAEYKKEQQQQAAAKKVKHEQHKPPKNEGQKFKSSKPDKEACWNCDALTHFSKDCPHPRRNRRRHR